MLRRTDPYQTDHGCGPSIAQEGERQADYGHDPQDHTDIDHHVPKEHRRHTAGDDSPKSIVCPHPPGKAPEDQGQIEGEHDAAPHKPPLFPKDRKDKIRMMFGEEMEFTLGPL